MRKQWLWVPFLLVLPLTGCGMGSVGLPGSIGSNSAGSGSSAVTVIPTGGVHGGQQPVTGSTIQLYAVGTAGYGSTPTALLTTIVTTSDGSGTANSNANLGNNSNLLPAGDFAITGYYNCPSSDPLVYITANGGNPGLQAGTNNSAIFLVSALTDCNSLKAAGSTTVLNINEITTVATAYALAQFADPSTGNIGSWSYSTQGLVNAGAAVSNLVKINTGAARSLTPGGNGLVPQQEINTLADILTPCVNTSGPSSDACTALFAAAKPSGGVAPANAFAAALDIARNPANNVATLFGLSTANAAFQPVLSTAPNDWTMALDFAGPGGGNQDLGIDASGNVWVASFAAGGATSSLSMMNNLGSVSFFDSGTNLANSVYGLAVDLTGDAWVAADGGPNSGATEFLPNGNSISGPFSFPETVNPEGVAVDGNNDVWITNSGSNSVTEFAPNGGNTVGVSPDNTGFTGGGLSGPLGIAIDSQNNAWIANYNNGSGNSITEITASQTVTGFTGGGLQAPASLAIDANGNVWVANYFSGSTTVSAFTSGGTPLASSPFSGGGIHNPISVAVDGANHIWIANESSSANSISELDATGSPLSPATTGYQSGQVGNLKNPWVLRIDGSGDIGLGNDASTSITTGGGAAQATLTEFIGLAAPAITSLAQAAQLQQIGKTPGTPIPVALASTTLPYYTLNTNYYAQLVGVGGNTGVFTFNLASGLPPLGFSLSASGSITGSSSISGTTSFDVKVCDQANSANCFTQTVSLTSANSLPLGGGESMLNGRYIMRIGGFNNYTVQNSGLVNGYDVVQSVVFDGAGGISAVSEDFNNPNSHSTLSTPSSATGYYTLGTDHRGVMVLNYPSSGLTLEYAFSVGNLNGSSIAQDMRLIEFDDTNPSGSHPYGTASGVGKLQSSTTLSTNQAWVFGLQGETPCTTVHSNGCPNGTISPYGAVSAVGRFFLDNANGISGGLEDAGANNTSYNGVTFTGTYTAPNSSGRGTLTLSTTGALFPAAPSNFVYYVVSPTELYLISVDAHTNFTMLSGDVLAQTATFTSASTLSGNYVAYESSPSDGDGSSFYPDASGATLIYIAATPGVQTISAVVEEAQDGQLQAAKQQGPFAYAIDANGRLVIGGSGAPIFYFASNTQGFATEQPDTTDDQGDAGLVVLEQQTAGPFSCSAATGTYFFGTVQPPIPESVNNGSVLQNGTGVGTITLDNSDTSGILTQGATQSITCTAADISNPNGTTGRFLYNSAGSNNVGYAVSPTKSIIMTTNPGDTKPSIIVVQQ